MLQVFTAVLLQMLKILLIAGLGFAFAKLKIFHESFDKVVSQLSTKFLMPMLSLYTFMTCCSVENFSANAKLLLYGVGLIAFTTALTYLLARFLAKPGTYSERLMRYAIAIPNGSVFATALTLAFLGTEGLFYQNLFLFTLTVMCYSWGIIQLQPASDKSSFKDTLRRIVNPNTVAMLAGMILGF